MHQANKIVLGAAQMSDSQIVTHPGDPATLKAGLAVSLGSSGTPSLTASAGRPIGVSRGKTLDDAKGVAVEIKGSRVGMQITAELTLSDLLFYAKTNDNVSRKIVLVDTGTAGAETVTITDDEDIDGGKVYTVGIEDGVSTATQVKAAVDGDVDASTALGVTIVGTGSNPQSEDEGYLSGDYAVPGTMVKRHATNGKAASNGGNTGAIYASGPLIGLDESGNEVQCALIDLQAGF